MSDAMRELAVEQRKRLVASILVHCEQSAWHRKLSPDEQRQLRQKVLDATGTYHDFLLDCIKVNRRTSVQNDEVMQVLRQVHADQRKVLTRINER